MTKAFETTGSRAVPPRQLLDQSVSRILICDDRSVTRVVLNQAVKVISSAHDIVCVADGFALADAYSARRAALVLIGHQRGRVLGLQATELLLSLYPTAAVIAFGSADARDMLAAAVVRGAKGIMVWDAERGHQAPIRADGWSWPSERRPAAGARDRLTERELQVLKGMSRGQSNAEIGRELFLSEDTIKTHARRLFHKLGARDRAHAVAVGMRNSYVA